MILLKYLFIFLTVIKSRILSRIHFIYTSIFMKGGCVTFCTGPPSAYSSRYYRYLVCSKVPGYLYLPYRMAPCVYSTGFLHLQVIVNELGNPSKKKNVENSTFGGEGPDLGIFQGSPLWIFSKIFKIFPKFSKVTEIALFWAF